MDKRIITASGQEALDQAGTELDWALREAVDALFHVRSCVSLIPAELRSLVTKEDKPEAKVFELLESIRAAQDAVVHAKGELLTLEVPNV